MKYNRSSSGFIVHPFETGNSKYHASYGKNANKTVKSFRTLRQAKAYLKSKGIKTALYDAPSGPRDVNLNKKITRSIKIEKQIERKARYNQKMSRHEALERLAFGRYRH